MTESPHYSGRGKALEQTPLGRLYRRLYVHPARFYGDLQHTGIINWHRVVNRFVEAFPSEARLLDLGAGHRRVRPGVIACDIAPNPLLDVVGDGHRLPFRNESLDGVVAQMMLEHVPRPQEVIAEIHRVLRPGGRVFCEVPFMYPVHDSTDYWRWTRQGLLRLCAMFRPVRVGVSMGPFSALSAQLRRASTLNARNLYLEAAIDLLMGWLLSPLKFLDELLPPSLESHLAAGAIYLVGAKQPGDD